MLANKLKSALITTASASALFLGLTSPASAIAFTWDPSAVGLSTAGSIIGPGATNLTIQDYATIYIPGVCFSGSCAAGSQKERALVPVIASDVGGGGLTPGSGISSIGATPWILYFDITATGSFNNLSAGVYSGNIDTLTYTMYGIAPLADNNGGGLGVGTTFCQGNGAACVAGGSVPTSVQGLGVALASGSLVTGSVTLDTTITPAVPGASARATFVPDAGKLPFFVSPISYVDINLFSAFTNTGASTVITTPGFSCNGTILIAGDSCIAISNGGGNANLVATTVPEPTTLSLFGMGLLGMGFMFRRRNTAERKA